MGVSHQTRTALNLLRSPVLVPVPSGAELDIESATAVAVPDVGALLAAAGIGVTTHGPHAGAGPAVLRRGRGRRGGGGRSVGG